MLWLRQVCRSVFSCNHNQARLLEGKSYCPDCGNGLIVRWVILRCSQCGNRREGTYQMRTLTPRHRCCIYCGETAVQYEDLDTPEYYQLDQAMLCVMEETDFVNDLAATYTSAWVDKKPSIRRQPQLLPA